MIESPVWFSKAPRFSGETRPRNPQRFRSETGARAAAAPGWNRWATPRGGPKKAAPAARRRRQRRRKRRKARLGVDGGRFAGIEGGKFMETQ